MNYRHIFHAGNFADVFKHWILTLLLAKLCNKDSPFCVFDTHAGIGIYNLQDVNAQKTQEAKSGIERLLGKSPAPEFNAYLNLVTKYYAEYNVYPGSPAIIQEFLRDKDRFVACELHPADYNNLQNNFKDDKRIKILPQDGYITLKAMLPPKERRGLIFIDPPFEKENEYDQIIKAIEESIKRFATGVYAIWYPIKDRKILAKFYNNLCKTKANNILAVELHANESVLNQLNSCGMVIINPPWQLEETLRSGMHKLLDYLNFTKGSFDLRTLKL